MEKNHKDLQPWLDYFDLLQTYEHKGYLEVNAPKHEAYVIQSALHAMSPGIDPRRQLQDGSILATLRRLRTYAAFLSTDGPAYHRRFFALHVVHSDPPHDLLYTILLTPHRTWRTLWRWREKVEVITYKSEE